LPEEIPSALDLPKEKIPIPDFSRRKKAPINKKSDLGAKLYSNPILFEEDQIAFYSKRHTCREGD